MPRPGVTQPQTRTFNYTSGTTVGAYLLTATNPENGTVSYTYNSDGTLATKVDANGNHFSYGYDNYKRLTTISVGGAVIRTFSYDTTTNSAGRLTAVQNAAINTGTANPLQVQFTEMFRYSAPGQVTGKRLQVNELTPQSQYFNVTQCRSRSDSELDGPLRKGVPNAAPHLAGIE